MSQPDLDAMAAEVVSLVKSALAPMQAALQAQHDQLQELQRRVQDDSLTQALGTLRERVAVVEVKAMQPGPPGEPGAAGKDGADGKAGLTYVGVYQEGKMYDVGMVSTWAGAAWHCNEPTETKPGDGSKAWTLMVKRGRDGRDGVAK